MKYYCPHCHIRWNHNVEKCIFCKGNIIQIYEEEYKIIGSSEVFLSSPENEKIPYYVYLLQDKNGNRIVRKSFEKFEIGDTYKIYEDIMNEKLIGIIGSGVLGTQIAIYLLQYHYPIIMKTRMQEKFSSIQSNIQKILLKKYNQNEALKIINNLKITTKFEDLSNCDIIIEAVPENINIKKDVFKILSKICKSSTIFTTNSSSLSIDEIAKECDRPSKFIGMHFLNPVHKMRLVEIIIGSDTSSETISIIKKFVQNIDKEFIIVKNSPAYIVNRLLIPQINEAVRLFEKGIASKEDIDKAAKYGLNHPMGPFELADFIGLDICLSILEILYNTTKDPYYIPANALCDLVKQGKLGIKTGEGFYLYKPKI